MRKEEMKVVSFSILLLKSPQNCTFSPKIIQKQKQSESTEKVANSNSNCIAQTSFYQQLKRSVLLYNKSKQAKQQLSTTDAELKNCTFKPAINSPK